VFGDPRAPAAVGGWLLVLCVCLAVWQPLNLAVAASAAMAALPVRGWPLGVLLGVRVVVTALGVGAALAIIGRRPGALALTRTALVVSAATELVVYGTSVFPNNRAPGDTPWYVAWTLVFHGGWLLYLWRSTRVRATLG
jgi:hypothetical protein